MARTYGPVLATVYTATALTNNAGFDANTFMSKWRSKKGAMLLEPTSLFISTLGEPNTSTVQVVLDAGGGVTSKINIFTYTTGAYNGEGAVWGFASEPQAGNFSSTSALEAITKQIRKLYGPISDGQGGYVSKKILKLYGSVNGQTKLIYEDTSV